MFNGRSGRRTGLLAVGVAATVLLLDTAVWAVACRRLDEGAREAVGAAGWVLDGAPGRWGGWPLAAAVTLHDATLRAGPEVVPPLTWTVPSLRLRLPAWSPTTLTLEADGAEQVAVGAAQPVPFTAGDLRARIDLSGRTPPRVDATALDVSGPTGPIRVGTATLLLLPDGWSADLAGLTFPGRDGRPVSPAIEALHVSGQLSPTVEPRPTAVESARTWRAQGGRLRLEMAGLRWGALAAEGQATIALDPALQPDLDGTVTASGLPAALTQLADTGAITAASSGAAQAMLAILAAPGGGGALTLPVTLRGGVVSVARFPVLRLAPIAWN